MGLAVSCNVSLYNQHLQASSKKKTFSVLLFEVPLKYTEYTNILTDWCKTQNICQNMFPCKIYFHADLSFALQRTIKNELLVCSNSNSTLFLANMSLKYSLLVVVRPHERTPAAEGNHQQMDEASTVHG